MKGNEQAFAETRKSVSSGIEEKIAIRLFTWIGAIAVAWAGILLVRLSFEHDWISPAVRIVSGVTIGIVFLGAGEWIHRRSARLAQGLSAAGIAVLYASFLAAHHLYLLIGALPAFFFLILTTGTAVLLSFRRGSITAVIGLLGGFLTPVWISNPHPSAGGLFLYLFLLQSGLLIVSRYRKSETLVFLTVAGSTIWTLTWLMFAFRFEDAILAGIYLAATLISFMLAAEFRNSGGAWKRESSSERICRSSAIAVLTLSAVLCVANHYSTAGWVLLATITSLLMLLGNKISRYDRMPWLAAGVIAILLFARAGTDNRLFVPTTFLLSFLIAAGAYFASWYAERPSRWATLSTAVPILYFLIAYLGSPIAGADLPWGALAIGWAALFVAAAYPVIRSRNRMAESYRTSASFAVGATAFLSFAVPLQLEHEWLAVAWAVESAAILWIESRLRVPVLRTIALAVAVLVVLRLLVPIGFQLRWHWMLYSYGIPILAFSWAALLAYRTKQARLSTAFQWLAILPAVLYATLSVRIAFHNHIWEPAFSLAESGILTLTWLLTAALFDRPGRAYSHRSLRQTAQALRIGAVLQVIVMQILFLNPLWNSIRVGNTPFVNQLMVAYALPGLAMIATAYLLWKQGEQVLTASSEVAGALLLFFFVTAQVRQYFHGAMLDDGFVSLLELSWYVTGWMFLGFGLIQAARLFRPLILHLAGKLIIFSGLIASLQFFVENPLWTHYAVGATPFWNHLLLLYGLPAALMIAISIDRRHAGEHYFSLCLEGLGILLFFFTLNLEVRQLFHGDYLITGVTSTLEKYTYSMAWILFACLLLVAGMLRNRILIRYYSLAFLLLAIGKVFLYDTDQLSGLYRFFSLMGLGLSLFFVAYLYQRFLFRKELRYE